MERQFNLIKTGTPEVEKRIFPRFPFSFLIFKAKVGSKEKIFEIRDISYTGMQISLKAGNHEFQNSESIGGTLNWKGLTLDVKGNIKWLNDQNIGVAFLEDENFKRAIREFLSVKNIISSMKPLHEDHFSVDLPLNLRYWLKADGPVEFFIWKHASGVISRFQILLFKDFVEWEDAKGVKTGLVITDRNVDTPLMAEDEFVFEMDEGAHIDKIRFALELIDHIPESYLPSDVVNFLKLKLRG